MADTLAPTGATAIPDPLKISKSKLKHLFGRKRVTIEDERPISESWSDTLESPTTPLSDAPPRSVNRKKPILPQRVHSDSVVPRRSISESRTSQQFRARSRASATMHPHSFTYAYSRALLRAMLKAPTKGLLDRFSLLPEARASQSVMDVALENGKSNLPQRTGPGKLEFSTSPMNASLPLNDKLFMLSDNGHILQFRVDGPPDRLPEKVLQLNRDSVAFVDEVAMGGRIVLNVLANGASLEDPKSPIHRSALTMLSFRSAEARRMVDSLQLVFDGVDVMTSWMSTIRTEVEFLKRPASTAMSPEFRPRNRPPIVTTSSEARISGRLSSLYRPRSSGGPFSHLATPIEDKELPQLPASSEYIRTGSGHSNAASSIATSTSLDKLRDSDDNSVLSGATHTPDGSFTLDSPVKPTFAEAGLSLSFLSSRSTASFERHIQPQGNTANQTGITERTTCTDIADSRSPLVPQRPVTSYEQHSSKPSLDPSKSGYTLFPKARTQELKNECTMNKSTDGTSVPASVPPADSSQALPHSSTDAQSEAAYSKVNRLITKKPAPLKLLTLSSVEQPQRSPAVTEDMLASNFGTAGLLSSPLSPVSPTFHSSSVVEALKFDFSFLKHDASRGSTRINEDGGENVRKQRSTPNLRHLRMPSAPAGPPPAGPLPAVPVLSPKAEHVLSPVDTRSPRCSNQHNREKSAASRGRRTQLRPPSLLVKFQNPSTTPMVCLESESRPAASGTEASVCSEYGQSDGMTSERGRSKNRRRTNDSSVSRHT